MYDTPAEPVSVEPYRDTADAVFDALQVDPERGLSSDEALRRLDRCGRNELDADAPRAAWRKFLDQFASILVILLIAAAAISAGLWLYESSATLPYEAIAILTIVILNAFMGYIQEARAERAAAALRNMSAARANVIRDGTRQSLLATEVVPGDIILVEEGDTIPADARLVQCIALQTAEAALTGESLPVSKDVAPLAGDAEIGDQRNMIFSGTIAVYGHGRAIVTTTGMRTEMGRIAHLLGKAADDATPLQKELDRVGKVLALAVVAVAVVMICTIFLVSEVRSVSQVLNVLIFGIALAVAAVPEGLPAIVTAVLSIGVQRMAKKNAIIRRLSAVETLGSATVIASDKTGTLTRNEMTVRRVVTASCCVNLSGTGYTPNGQIDFVDQASDEEALQFELARALTAADRANNAVLQERDGSWVVQGDPTEGALIVAARKAGLSPHALEARFPRIGEIPFSSERKIMSTVHKDAERPERLIVLTKGAPDVLLGHCSHELVGRDAVPLTDARRREIMASNEALAAEALRTLGVAFRSLPPDDRRFGEHFENDLVFLGLIGMIDPPRQEARDAVARAKSAGIRSIMITGDHPRTAAIIAAELGIGSGHRALSGADIQAMSQDDLDRAVNEASVYARVNPEHKLRIVEALQRSGETVSMTGDGVNDAPALKAADIGVAMGITGTDVSKEAADMVLVDDNFATIVAAVEEGRAIFLNIRSFLRYLLSSNIGEVMTMFFGVLLAGTLGLSDAANGLVLPLLATQILWINLVTDGAPALAIGVDPADAGVMRRPPRPRGEGVLTRRMWSGIIFAGAIMAAGTLLVLDACLPAGLIEGAGTIDYGRTMAFTTLVMYQLLNVFNARSDERSAFVDMFSNGWVWAAVALSIVLHVFVIYTPFLQEAFSTVGLGLMDWVFCAAVASSVLWLCELRKIALRALPEIKSV